MFSARETMVSERLVSSRTESSVVGSPLGYQPALDGLRGVSVLAVLMFHAGLSWATGGYLGVSVFFTLSGFLITRLMLEEGARTGGVDLPKFYGRRLRRLVPASALTLLAIVVLARAGAFAPVTALRRQIVGAAMQLGNWTQLTSSKSYADLFGSQASPVDHYWSLAVEEQFYLLWPVVLAPFVARSFRSARRVVLALFVGSVVLAPIIGVVWGTDAVYLATPSRIAEILAGAALAVVLDVARIPSKARLASIVAGCALLVAMVATPTDHGWAYHGGLPLFAVLSAVVVAGALTSGPVRSLLSWRPFVFVGTISYSLYLVHWPIFLLVDRHLPTLTSMEALAVKLTVSLVVAVAVSLAVEQPLRAMRLQPATVPVGLAVVLATLLTAAVVVSADRAGFDPTTAGVERRSRPVVLDPNVAAPPTGVSATSPSSSTSVAPSPFGVVVVPPKPIRVMVVGDSTGDVIGGGLVAWSNEHPSWASVEVRSVLGCGFVRGGSFGNWADGTRTRCEGEMWSGIPATLRADPPDVVVISISLADTWSRSWDGGPMLRATDPSYTARIHDGYDAFFAILAEAGVRHVLWLRPPRAGLPQDDPSFSDGSQELVEHVVEGEMARYPAMVTMLDYRSWFETTDMPDSATARPDRVHLAAGPALRVATEFLGPAITRTFAGS